MTRQVGTTNTSEESSHQPLGRSGQGCTGLGSIRRGGHVRAARAHRPREQRLEHERLDDAVRSIDQRPRSACSPHAVLAAHAPSRTSHARTYTHRRTRARAHRCAAARSRGGRYNGGEGRNSGKGHRQKLPAAQVDPPPRPLSPCLAAFQ
eukprot:3739868-Pleurochrysis_carterae.AAC.2